MPQTKAQKTEILAELTESVKGAKSVVFADFQGITVKEMKAIRKEMTAGGVTFKIAKKTLLKLAAKESGYEDIPSEVVEGPVGAAFSMEDELAAAKIVFKFGKINKNLKLRGALFEGRVLSVAETKVLAMLPGKEELIAKLLYMLKYPIQGFHGVLNNTLSGFVRVLDAVREQKEKAA